MEESWEMNQSRKHCHLFGWYKTGWYTTLEGVVRSRCPHWENPCQEYKFLHLVGPQFKASPLSQQLGVICAYRNVRLGLHNLVRGNPVESNERCKYTDNLVVSIGRVLINSRGTLSTTVLRGSNTLITMPS